MQRVRGFAFDVGITFISSLVSMLLGLVISVVIGRYLGARDLGLYRITFTLYGIMMLFATVGIPAALIKYVAEFKEDKNKVNQIVSSGVITSLLLGFIFIPLLYFSSGAIAKIYNSPELSDLLKILSLVFPFALVGGALNGLLNGLREMKKLAVAVIVQSTLMILVTVPLVYYGFGVRGALIGVVLSTSGYCLVTIYLSKKYFEIAFDNYVKTTKMMLQFGIKIFAAGSINEINNQVDTLLVGFFLVPADVGYYTVAIGLSSFFWIIPLSLQKITYPATSSYWCKKDYGALNNMINKSIKYCTIVLVLCGLGVAFFAEYITTTIFKQDFIQAVLPLQILLVGTVIRGSIAQPIGGSLAGVGKPGLDLKIITIISIINLTLDIILIPRIGIAGAAIATTMSLSVGAFIGLYLVVKYLHVRIDTSWFLKILIVILASIVLFKFGVLFLNPFLLGGIILAGYSLSIFHFLLMEEDKDIFKLLHYH